MSNLALDRPVSSLTASDLKELIREVLREEREYYLDEEGYLVFAHEAAYSAYLDRQEGKLPSEVKARFIDEQGYIAFYSDWEPTPEKAKELDEIKQEIAEGDIYDFDEVVKELGLSPDV